MGDKKDPARLAALTYVQVNTEEHFDRALITRFYNGLMKTNFPIEDELEPLDVWLHQLDPQYQASVAENVYLMNQMIALDMNQNDAEGPKIAGGISFEYYKEGDSALVTYFVVDPSFRRIGLVTELLRRATDILNEQARKLGRPPLAAILAETNKAGVEDGVLLSTTRHEIQSRLGFCRLSYDYIQPPLSEGQEPCSELLLLIWQPGMAADQQQLKEGRIPAKVVRDWYNGFCHALMGYDTDPSEYAQAPWYTATLNSLATCERTGIRWQASTPWKEEEKKVDAAFGKSAEVKPVESKAEPTARSLTAPSGPRAGWAKVSSQQSEAGEWVLADEKGEEIGVGCGLKSLAESLDSTRVLFGAIRVMGVDAQENVTSKRPKITRINWVGAKVPPMKKMGALSGKAKIAEIWPGTAASVDATSQDELNMNALAVQLLKSGGAHKPTHYDFGDCSIPLVDVKNRA
jgi:RimJ/RimL family protein N-acetyltransferase